MPELSALEASLHNPSLAVSALVARVRLSPESHSMRRRAEFKSSK